MLNVSEYLELDKLGNRRLNTRFSECHPFLVLQNDLVGVASIYDSVVFRREHNLESSLITLYYLISKNSYTFILEMKCVGRAIFITKVLGDSPINATVNIVFFCAG